MKVNRISTPRYGADSVKGLTEELSNIVFRYASIHSQVWNTTSVVAFTMISDLPSASARTQSMLSVQTSVEVQNANRFSPMSNASGIQ